MSGVREIEGIWVKREGWRQVRPGILQLWIKCSSTKKEKVISVRRMRRGDKIREAFSKLPVKFGLFISKMILYHFSKNIYIVLMCMVYSKICRGQFNIGEIYYPAW